VKLKTKILGNQRKNAVKMIHPDPARPNLALRISAKTKKTRGKKIDISREKGENGDGDHQSKRGVPECQREYSS